MFQYTQTSNNNGERIHQAHLSDKPNNAIKMFNGGWENHQSLNNERHVLEEPTYCVRQRI